MKQIADKISGSELKILTVLWDASQPLTLTQIHQELEPTRNWDISTVKTLTRRLCEKGAVEARKDGIYHYHALISREEYSAWSTKTLIDRLFRGSARQLVASLVEGEQLTATDVRELLEELDRGQDHE